VTAAVVSRRAGLILALVVLIFSAEALKVSATRLYPGYDEIDYLALGRQVARNGGVVGTVRCYLEGRCLEDNRPPLYQLLLSAVLDESPAAYARAKLFSLAIGLGLIALVWAITRRVMAPPVAVTAAVLVGLMPVMTDYAARLMHDVLFAGLTFGAVYAVVACQERGAIAWAGAGALIGLAFLTKGSGHLLWLPLLATSLYRHRQALPRRLGLYAAAVAFTAVAFFLLWRNWVVWHAPFHNINAGEVWLDRWSEVWVMRLSPEHAQLGLGWYLRHHSILDLVVKVGKGVGQVVGLFIYTAGVGFWNPVARVVTGLGALVLAGLGLRRRWRGGKRVEVVAVLSTVGAYAAALTLGTSGAPGPQVRYVLPYVLLLVPYAALELCEGAWPLLRARLGPPGGRVEVAALGALAALLSVRLALGASVALRADPRTLYAVDPRWRETSDWLSRALAPGERFALPYMSRYSTWDLPRPDLDARWPFSFGVPGPSLLGYLEKQGIRKVLIDTADVGWAEYADKLGRQVDAKGSLAFLDWPRCFADDPAPSRFMIFCRR
jgi:4-amino-4-deoxy-L-arabinose transferase-like glycosyltransferase